MQVLYNAQLFVFIWSKKVTPVLFKVRCRAKRKPVVWEHILGRVNARGLMYKKRSNDGTKRSRFQFTASKTNNFCTSVTAYEIASSRRIALYSSFDSCWCPHEISFFTDQLALPTPCGTQVCHAEGFRLFKQASGRSGKVSPGTKELLF